MITREKKDFALLVRCNKKTVMALRKSNVNINEEIRQLLARLESELKVSK